MVYISLEIVSTVTVVCGETQSTFTPLHTKFTKQVALLFLFKNFTFTKTLFLSLRNIYRIPLTLFSGVHKILVQGIEVKEEMGGGVNDIRNIF